MSLEIVSNALITVGVICVLAALVIMVENARRKADALWLLVSCADMTSRQQPGWKTEINADGENLSGMLYRGSEANILIAGRDCLYLSKDRTPKILARYERSGSYGADKESFWIDADKIEMRRYAERLATSFAAVS